MYNNKSWLEAVFMKRMLIYAYQTIIATILHRSGIGCMNSLDWTTELDITFEILNWHGDHGHHKKNP